ncbi:MAG TPA: MFS transporter, partial [Crocinitomicaceae bacterium]|nr:MFS transporter [Crocinitomicaceae bacterium]
WYLAIAIAQKLAAVLGGQVEQIKQDYSLSHFFLLFTFIPLAAAVLIMLLHPVLKKLLHGVR